MHKLFLLVTSSGFSPPDLSTFKANGQIERREVISFLIIAISLELEEITFLKNYVLRRKIQRCASSKKAGSFSRNIVSRSFTKKTNDCDEYKILGGAGVGLVVEIVALFVRKNCL